MTALASHLRSLGWSLTPLVHPVFSSQRDPVVRLRPRFVQNSPIAPSLLTVKAEVLMGSTLPRPSATVVLCPPCTLPDASSPRAAPVVFPLLHPQSLGQCLAQNRGSVNPG